MERIAQVLLSNISRDMWSETYKIKGHNQTLPCSIDGDKENAKVFNEKYKKDCTLLCHTMRMTCVISSLR